MPSPVELCMSLPAFATGRIAALLATCTLLGTSCSTAPVALMTWPEYKRVRHVVPYVLDISSGDGRLVYVGSRHTNDPDSLSVATIESLWSQVEPDVAFNEGGAPPTHATREDAIRLSGEPGLVRFLAARDRVRVASLDPTKAQLAARLNPEFGAELVKMGFLLSQVRHHRNNPTETFAERMARTFAILNKTPGLEGKPMSLEELAERYRALFPTAGDFRQVPDSWFDPAHDDNIMNELSRRTNEERDRFIIDLLVRHVCDGKRVFAVVGASHVVMQERALRDALRGCVAENKP